MTTKPPSKLRGRDPSSVEPSKPKIAIYGPPGVGKTWAAIDFPAVFYIDTEGGADLDHYRAKLKASGASYFGPEDGALDFASVLEQVQALATEDHDRKTLVIDSLSKLFNNQIVITQEKMAKAGIEDAFGASKKEAIGYMRRLIAWVNKLDMNVILIHHQKSQWKDGKEVGVTFDGWDKLEYELHLVLRIAKLGPDRRAFIGKTRLEKFPDGESFPWSFQDFAKRYGEAVIGRASTKANLASEAQVAEYASILAKVKIPEDIATKWESAAPDVRLLPEEALTKRIAWLKAQLAAQTVTA